MFEAGSSALNDSQARAVAHGEGPLLIVAGAGTGKTRTLAARVGSLIDRGIAPERILLLTFTRRAAKEMLERAGRASSPTAAGRVWGGTFHSVANRLLRLHGRAIGLPPGFTVMDQGDATDLMNLVRDELGLGARTRRFPRKDTLMAIYSRVANARTKLGDVISKSFPWCDDLDGIRSVFEGYATRKREQGLLDYDDLLLFWNALMATPKAGDVVAALFDHILVDEYQDTNAIQADILRAMRRTSDNITVVGDDAQAIYSFRSATVTNMLEFPARFPGTTIVKLERNYRSTQPVLEPSNAVISAARRRYEKRLESVRPGGQRPVLFTCIDEAHQSAAVCEEVLHQREQGMALQQQAVLFRTGHHSAHLEIELARRNIPYVKFGGLRFVEAAHVKDVLSLLRILENPHDELAWFRVLQLVEGIGPGGARRLLTDLGVRPAGERPATSPLELFLGCERPPRASKDDFSGLQDALSDCANQSKPPALEVERLRAWCEPTFMRVYDHARARIEDIERLEKIATSYKSRHRFIVDLTLDPPSSTGELAGPPLLDEEYLILSTIHSAKGGEWDAVHVIHAADGMIPSDMSTSDEDEVEEERRLFYVALTRARDVLRVYFPLRYYHRGPAGDLHSYSQMTRFLPAEVRALFEERHLGDAEAEEEAVSVGPAEVFVDGALAALWSD